MKNNINARIAALRGFMRQKGLKAFIIPSTDPHVSEYPAAHWESRMWISGFTGSAGTAVVTMDKAGLWTDSRYFLQAAAEIADNEFVLFKDRLPETPSFADWLMSELKPGDKIGIDGRVYAARDARALEEKFHAAGYGLVSDYDPFATIWEDRPPIPDKKIFIHPEKFAGESARSKIARVVAEVNRNGADALMISTLDTIAWLFNIRGDDVAYVPVAVSYAYVSKDRTVFFIDPAKLTPEVSAYLAAQGVETAPYDGFYDFVSEVRAAVCIESAKITYALYNTIPRNCRIVDIVSPADLMKSMKNGVEIAGFREAMRRDGVALTQFYMWLEKAVPRGEVTEYNVGVKLAELRGRQENFQGEGFCTIAGYGPNGALNHYHPTPESAHVVRPEGFLLIDSGGHYLDGTTDITRTVAVGPVTEQMKSDFTLVLRCCIGLSRAVFPQGTRGSNIDILARQAMWEHGINYLHGTGHGIGEYLSVHEGPQSIRQEENPVTIRLGIVTSNEPGIYRDGHYGVRTENVMVSVLKKATDFGNFYGFETISLCFIDTAPVIKEMMTPVEIEWLNDYHKMVCDELSPRLTAEEQAWLKARTAPI